MSEKQTHESNFRQRSLVGREEQKRIKQEKQIKRRRAALGVMAVLATVGGVEAVDHLTAAKSQNVTEIIQPGEGLSSAAVRAETEFGAHPDQFNINEEVYRLTQKYGSTTQPGEKVVIQVK